MSAISPATHFASNPLMYSRAQTAISLFPVAVAFLFTVGLAAPATRDLILPLVHPDPSIREDGWLEQATFFLSLLAVPAGILLCMRRNLSRLERLFFALFCMGMLFIAME